MSLEAGYINYGFLHIKEKDEKQTAECKLAVSSGSMTLMYGISICK